jgi:hypothetical protein
VPPGFSPALGELGEFVATQGAPWLRINQLYSMCCICQATKCIEGNSFGKVTSEKVVEDVFVYFEVGADESAQGLGGG